MIENAYWIKCDIDGRGEQWRLAIESLDETYFDENDEPARTYCFPIEEYEDFKDNYEEHEKIIIMTPDHYNAIEYHASEVAQYMCDNCPATGYGTKPNNNSCNGCPNEELKRHLEME